MVIANSDSTSTLVSLQNNLKRVASLSGWSDSASISEPEENDFYPSALRTPEDPYFDDDDNDFCFSPSASQPIYLPTAEPQTESSSSPSKHAYSVDECLQCIPSIRDRCDELLAAGTTHFSPDDDVQQRILYVGQGEMAHAVPLQCDVLMSDKTTSCHVLILRSTSSEAMPLATCAHIDGTQYEDSVRAAVQHHANHHHAALAQSETIQMDIHVVGGFRDEGSQAISAWLMRLLAEIADEEDFFRMTLATCAISSMNEAGNGCPIGRGLAIELRTGDVFLASCDTALAGPSPTLRSARLWSSSNEHNKKKQLHIIHHERSNHVAVQPFHFHAFPDLPSLLSLPDNLLLRCTSTSPQCEEADFCHSVRSTLSFLQSVPCQQMFGPRLDTPLVYRRRGRTNTWVAVGSC